MDDRNSILVSFLGIFCVATLPSSFGVLPLSLKQAPVMGQLAAIGMFLGCAGLIIAVFWRNRDGSLLIEQVAAALLGFGSAFYAAALITAAWIASPKVGPWWRWTLHAFAGPAIAFGMTAGLAVGCVIRYFKIQRYIHNRKQAAARPEP